MKLSSLLFLANACTSTPTEDTLKKEKKQENPVNKKIQKIHRETKYFLLPEMHMVGKGEAPELAIISKEFQYEVLKGFAVQKEFKTGVLVEGNPTWMTDKDYAAFYKSQVAKDGREKSPGYAVAFLDYPNLTNLSSETEQAFKKTEKLKKSYFQALDVAESRNLEVCIQGSMMTYSGLSDMVKENKANPELLDCFCGLTSQMNKDIAAFKQDRFIEAPRREFLAMKEAHGKYDQVAAIVGFHHVGEIERLFKEEAPDLSFTILLPEGVSKNTGYFPAPFPDHGKCK